MTFGHVEKTAVIAVYCTIAVDILSNISRNKGNQTMKLGQLIACSNQNIFLQKLYRI